jgi:hypothetical protein
MINNKIKYLGVCSLIIGSFYLGTNYCKQNKIINNNHNNNCLIEELKKNPYLHKEEITDLCIFGLKEFPGEIYSKIVREGKSTIFDYYREYRENKKIE